MDKLTDTQKLEFREMQLATANLQLEAVRLDQKKQQWLAQFQEQFVSHDLDLSTLDWKPKES
jgi:ABC-type phosphate transport system auxiliary subunit